MNTIFVTIIVMLTAPMILTHVDAVGCSLTANANQHELPFITDTYFDNIISSQNAGLQVGPAHSFVGSLQDCLVLCSDLVTHPGATFGYWRSSLQDCRCGQVKPATALKTRRVAPPEGQTFPIPGTAGLTNIRDQTINAPVIQLACIPDTPGVFSAVLAPTTSTCPTGATTAFTATSPGTCAPHCVATGEVCSDSFCTASACPLTSPPCLSGYNKCTDCAPGSCQNGGTCVEGFNTFTCLCADGYTGAVCDTLSEVNECAISNGGCATGTATCTDTTALFSCACNPGYSGDGFTCVDVNECATSNGGCGIGTATCTNEPGSFSCADVNECASNHGGCSVNGHCDNQVGGFTCTCIPGYSGDGVTCVNIDDCTPNPCQNGGVCVDGVESFTCNCANGYSGDVCEINIDDCAPNPCQNGGVCVDGVASFTCNCATGYSGPLCQTNIDDCSPNPCQNGGVCADGVASFTCNCANGYSGPLCQTNIDDCAPNQCANGGVCVDGVASYSCNCAAGYSGPICQTNIDDCTPNPCQNSGACTDGVNAFTCNCAGTGYSGTLCQTDINECETLNGGCSDFADCVNTPRSRTCSACYPGFSGDGITCTDVDECATNHGGCSTDATCTNSAGGFSCLCNDGFTGDGFTCTSTPQCVPNPCNNGATCVPMGSSAFQCVCAPNFSGTICNKVTICHKGKTITVAYSGWTSGHSGHPGDFIGSCP